MVRVLLAAIVVAMAGGVRAQGTAAGAGARPAAHGKTEVTWYGHAAFVVRTPKGTVLAVDPWFANPVAKKAGLQPPQKIDYILLTHAHADHAGNAVALAQATHAAFVGSSDLARVLIAAGYPMDPSKLFQTAGNMGGTIDLDDEVSVTMVPAVHSSAFQVEGQVPQYGGAPVGFVIRIRGGPTLYHTGDTDLFSDMQLIPMRHPIDVMLTFMGGHTGMDPVAAAQAVAWVHPRITVPMHFGTYPMLTGTPAQFRAALQKRGAKAKVVEFQPGETRTF